MQIEKNKKLSEYNFYKIDARAEYFTELKNKSDFVEVFVWIRENNIKKFAILGEGANTIFVKQNYDGLVIKIANNFLKWEKLRSKASKFRVEVGAGKNWDSFLATCQRKGFYEIQSMSYIPGSVGAAVFGNIGAFGTEVKKYVAGVWVFDRDKKDFVFFNNDELDFSYRNSYLKENKDRIVIYSVVFDFSHKFQKEMQKKYADDEYFSLAHFAKKHGLGKLKKSDIRKSIKKIRRAVYPNLKKYPNAGSTFKNTEVTKTQLKKIIKKYSDIPNWPLENGRVKIPTAYILDKVLHLNGKQFGNIQIDEKRPLFFTNMGGATGEEFYKLCQKVKKMVKKELGVEIEEEVGFVK